jgi:hypothetical protein
MEIAPQLAKYSPKLLLELYTRTDPSKITESLRTAAANTPADGNEDFAAELVEQVMSSGPCVFELDIGAKSETHDNLYNWFFSVIYLNPELEHAWSNVLESKNIPWVEPDYTAITEAVMLITYDYFKSIADAVYAK